MKRATTEINTAHFYPSLFSIHVPKFNTKGVSTAEGGRRHVTTHTTNVLSEIQTHVPDMPKIDIE